MAAEVDGLRGDKKRETRREEEDDESSDRYVGSIDDRSRKARPLVLNDFSCFLRG